MISRGVVESRLMLYFPECIDRKCDFESVLGLRLGAVPIVRINITAVQVDYTVATIALQEYKINVY